MNTKPVISWMAAAMVVCTSPSAFSQTMWGSSNSLIVNPATGREHRFITGNIVAIADRDNMLTISGDWLNTTTEAKLVKLVQKSDTDWEEGSASTLSFTTGVDGHPFVKLNLRQPAGYYKLSLYRPAGIFRDVNHWEIRVIKDPYIESVVLSRTSDPGIVYENAYPVGGSIKMEVTGRNLVELWGVRERRASLFLEFDTDRLSEMISTSGCPNAPNIRFVTNVRTTDRPYTAHLTSYCELERYDFRESDFYLQVQFLGFQPVYEPIPYSFIRTHRNNGSPLNYVRFYGPPRLTMVSAENKFNDGARQVVPFERPADGQLAFRGKNPIACPQLVKPEEQIRDANALKNPEALISRYGLPAPGPTDATPTRMVSWPDIRITLKNNSWGFQNACTATVKSGNTVLGTVNVPAMIGRSTAVVTFTRPESRKLLARSTTCLGVYELMKPPFDWQDPALTLEMRPSNAAGNQSFNFSF